MSNSFTLQIHDQGKENEWEDIDDYETVGYQIPYSLKWEEVLELLGADFDATDSNFKYIDEDRDKVSIGSQDEYEIALQFCRKSRDTLHIYAEKITFQPKKNTENRKQEKKGKVLVDRMDSSQCEEDYRLLRPPDYEEEERKAVEGDSKLSDAGGSDDEEVDGNFSSVQDAMVSSTTEEEAPVRSYEETKPMTTRLPYLDAIRKEVHEMVQQELVEFWNELQVLKEDVSERFDAIGERLTSPEQTETDEIEKQEECRSVTCDKRSANKNDFAASFICENLLDGSKVNVNSKFQKYWLFKNEGEAQWDENTQLQLQDERCLPCSTNTEISTAGPSQKSVSVPALCKNGTGDVCVNHLAPAHPCNYQSSWRLTHNGNVFGPRVWCNVCVVDESGSSVDSLPHEEVEMNHCSFEVVTVDEEQKKDEPSEQEESRQRSLVPPDKCHVDRTGSNRLKQDENHHDDDSLLMTAFDMYNISDGARYIRTPSHDSEAYSPVKNRKDKNQEAVINVFNRCKDEDEVIPKETDQTGGKPHCNKSQVQEIPKVAEEINNEEEESPSRDPVPETLDQEEEVEQVESDAEEDVALENFREPPLVPTPENEDLLSNEDEDEEEEGGREENQEYDEPTEGQKDEVSSCSDDLHSVDYNLDDNASMTSYDVSDFVVVPLPECFDVNQPLKANDEPEPAEVEEPVDVDEGSDHEDEEDQEDSEEEQDSQPNSRIRMPEYKSEDSLPTKSVTPRNSILDPPAVPEIEAPILPRVTPPLTPEAPEMVQSTACLSNAIFQNLDAFKTNPSNPPQPSTRSKIPMNQIKTTEPATLFVSPKPVPRSVLDLDKPYPIDGGAETAPMFVPFEQGWRRNPIPLPSSIGNEDPWLPPVPKCSLPQSEFTLNRNSSGLELTRPSAVARTPDVSFGSSFDETRVKEVTGFGRPLSPVLTNELADDFYPAMEPAEDNYHTPPPSPPALYDDIFVPSIEPSPLDRLYEMGFNNVELNEEIYNSCNGDMNRTVQALVLRMEADTTLLG